MMDEMEGWQVVECWGGMGYCCFLGDWDWDC